MKALCIVPAVVSLLLSCAPSAADIILAPGTAVHFGDGTVQTTAQVAGPQGEPGPQGPPGEGAPPDHGGVNCLASGTNAYVGGGSGNQATAPLATVGGGQRNYALAAYATVSGGGPADPSDPESTNNKATDQYCVIGGGGENLAGNNEGTSADAAYATVSGGHRNFALAPFATIGGGGPYVDPHLGLGPLSNTVHDAYGTIGGGCGNVAGDGVGSLDDASNATVGGGRENVASGKSSTVSGGEDCSAEGYCATACGGRYSHAVGDYSTVAGGFSCVASGDHSFAAGRGVTIDEAHDGAILFGDNANTFVFLSVAANEFAARATGGVRFVTAVNDHTPTAGVHVAPGGSSWSTISDRAAKENFRSVDGVSVLEKVVEMPVQTWNYKTQDDQIRHIGPVAQDFRKAFGVGEDATHITTVDADGVALAAIQGLNAKLAARDLTIEKLERKLLALEERLAALEGKE